MTCDKSRFSFVRSCTWAHHIEILWAVLVSIQSRKSCKTKRNHGGTLNISISKYLKTLPSMLIVTSTQKCKGKACNLTEVQVQNDIPENASHGHIVLHPVKAELLYSPFDLVAPVLDPHTVTKLFCHYWKANNLMTARKSWGDSNTATITIKHYSCSFPYSLVKRIPLVFWHPPEWWSAF